MKEMVKKLIENKSFAFMDPLSIKNRYDAIEKITDKEYSLFLKENNGGYFFKNAIHIYGTSENYLYHDILFINRLIHDLYGKLALGFFFAEDVFGNLFGFIDKNIIYFNIETAEKTKIADSFTDWAAVLIENIDYYTAYSFLETLDAVSIKQLTEGKRLSPKMPFILGGEYELKNLMLKDYRKNLMFNASIAIQIHDLPDGTKVKIKIE